MDNYSSKKHQPQPDFRDYDVLYKRQENRKRSSGDGINFFGIPIVGNTSLVDNSVKAHTTSVDSTNSNISTNTTDNTRKSSISQMITGFFKPLSDGDIDRKISLDDYMNTRRRESINGDGFSKQDYMTKDLVDSLKIGKPKF